MSTVSLCEFSMGLGFGWTAPMMNLLHDSKNQRFSLNTAEVSWVASLHELGRTFGTLVTALCADVIGRKMIFVICTTIYFLMWVVVFFTESVWILYVVRTVFGLTCGINDTVAPIYTGETCSPQLRGIFGSISLSFFYAGELIAFILATYLSYSTVALVQATIQLFILFSVFLLKEPAHFLIMKGQYEKADQVFHWLKGFKNEDTAIEFDDIKKNVLQEKTKLSYKHIFSTKANYKSITIFFIISCATLTNGYGALTAFVSMAFTSSDIFTANEFTILFGIFQLISVCLSSFYIEKFSRRRLFMTAFVVSAIVQACTAALYYVQENLTELPYFPWLIFSTITLFATTHSMGILPVYYVVQGELFPQSVKAIGGSIAISANSAMGFLSAKLFLTISESFGIYTNFAIFSFINLITLVYVYYELPETKGKSLIEIQKSF